MPQIREIEIPPAPSVLADIAELYEAAGWGGKDDAPAVGRALAESRCAYGAFEGGKLVGFFRALGDGVSDAYLLDLAVLPRYRGKGVASALVGAVVAKLKAEGAEWITCIASPGAEKVYSKYGKKMEGFTPFRF